MLARATHRAHLSSALIELKQMDVTKLDFLDATFDAAVATFLFCVLPDELQLPALRELDLGNVGAIVRFLPSDDCAGSCAGGLAMKSDLTFADAVDLALRYSCKLPDWHENDPRAALWIAVIAELPTAEEQGRLGAATREADRLAAK
jgi:hypothetical protein